MLVKQKTESQWHENDLRTIENYRPIDDDFMRALFRNELPLAQRVLRIITGIEDLELTTEVTQYDMKFLLGARSICLDVLGTDSKGRKLDLEIQKDDRGAAPQRARYHSSAIDVDSLKANDDFTDLPISYVIFITENDVRGENKLIYNFEWIDTASGTPLGDGAHIIFVNGAYDNANDTSDLAKLVHDFRCNRADDMLIKELADRTRYFKETPKGVSEMCKAIEDMRNEVAKEAEMLARIQFATKLINRGKYTFEEVAEDSGLTIDEVNELAAELSAANA